MPPPVGGPSFTELFENDPRLSFQKCPLVGDRKAQMTFGLRQGRAALNTQTSSPAPALLCLEQVSAPGFKYLDLQPVPTVGGTLSKPSKRPPPASATPFCFSSLPAAQHCPCHNLVCLQWERKKFTASRTLPLCKFLPKLNWGVQWGGGICSPRPRPQPSPSPLAMESPP